MCELRVLGIKRERNETLKATRLVLLLAQTNHVIDTIFNGFNVTVKHRRVGLQSGAVHRAREIQPTLRVALMRTNHRSGWLAKNLSAAARARIKTSIHQLLNHVLVAHLIKAREVIQLNHRESLQVQLRILLL